MKSFLVIGLGNFGTHLAERMQELGNDVMVVDRNGDIVDGVAHKFTDAHIGDCCNEQVIRTLGVNNFDCCFVTIGEDFPSSLEVSAILKEYGAKHVVTKANSSRQARMLLKIGADEVVYPERDMAEKVAVRYNVDNIFDYIELTSEYSIFEIPCNPKWYGKTVVELNVRNKYHVNIIAVKRDNTLNANIDADYVFNKEDHLLVIGRATDVFKIGGRVEKVK